MASKGSDSLIDAANEYFDALVKSRFIEMFGDPLLNPKCWESKSLHGLTSVIRNGTTPAKAKSVYTHDGVVFLQSQNVWNNRIEFTNVQYISEELNNKMIATQLEEGDVLITKTGRINTENSSLGRVSLFRGFEKPVNISSEIYLVRAKNDLNPEFLMQLLLTDSYKRFIRNCSPGGTDKRHLYSRYVEQFKIIVPPIELQNQFADFVKQVDKSKLIFQQMVSKYDELVKSRFIEMFENNAEVKKWPTVKLGSIAQINDGEHQSPDKVPQGNLYLMARNITKNRSLDLSKIAYVDDSTHATILSRCCPEYGDILLTNTGTIGNMVMMPEMPSPSLDRGITLIKYNRNIINGFFLMEQLSMPSLQSQMTQETRASAIAHLFLKQTKNLSITLPPIELQNKFADFVKQVDKSKSEILEGLKKLRIRSS